MNPREVVDECQKILAHAWMVRTFVKHSDEVEEFPELMNVVRTVFDISRALETKIDDPPGYLHMLRKKIGKLRKAAEQFRRDAPLASTHTNFQQAVISIDACVESLERWLASAPAMRMAAALPPNRPADDDVVADEGERPDD